MNETNINNIVLDKDRFIVFATINNNDEVQTFDSNVTTQQIKDWLGERQQFYDDLKEKEKLLKGELCE